MWVFGFGSLMWDDWEQAFGGIKYDRVRLPNYYRSFNKKSIRNWGTKNMPAPTLGLEQQEGSECIGTAFEFDDERRKEVEAYLTKREGRSFELTEQPVLLENGRTVIAIVPINKPDDTYIGDLSLDMRARMASKASGISGRCVDYIKGIYNKLHDIGIEDAHVQQMWEAIRS